MSDRTILWFSGSWWTWTNLWVKWTIECNGSEALMVQGQLSWRLDRERGQLGDQHGETFL